MTNRISDETGNKWPHGTGQRYRYEVQLQREGGPPPCRKCKDANIAQASKSRAIRTAILDRFRDRYPLEYKAWYKEFEERYEPRASESPSNGSTTSTP